MNHTLPDCLLSSWQTHANEIHLFLKKELKQALKKEIHNKELVEDLLQDTFLKAAAQGHKFCDVKQPRAWFYRVAKNLVIDVYRNQQKMPTVLMDTQEDEIVALQLDQATSMDDNPIENLDVCLSKNIQTLAAKDRDIIECCDIQGIAQTTYALDHDLTLPAVKSRLQRARVQLKKNIIKNCHVTFDAQGHVCDYTAKTCL